MTTINMTSLDGEDSRSVSAYLRRMADEADKGHIASICVCTVMTNGAMPYFVRTPMTAASALLVSLIQLCNLKVLAYQIDANDMVASVTDTPDTPDSNVIQFNPPKSN